MASTDRQIDRNADTHERHRRNWQRLKEGAATGTIVVSAPLHNTGSGITFGESDNETPTGTPNGSLTTFGISHVPVSGSVKVYLNGQRLVVGGSDDYTISAQTITFLIAPHTGDKIRVDYLY